jgi:hypothetical protein
MAVTAGEVTGVELDTGAGDVGTIEAGDDAGGWSGEADTG